MAILSYVLAGVTLAALLFMVDMLVALVFALTRRADQKELNRQVIIEALPESWKSFRCWWSKRTQKNWEGRRLSDVRPPHFSAAGHQWDIEELQSILRQVRVPAIIPPGATIDLSPSPGDYTVTARSISYEPAASQPSAPVRVNPVPNLGQELTSNVIMGFDGRSHIVRTYANGILAIFGMYPSGEELEWYLPTKDFLKATGLEGMTDHQKKLYRSFLMSSL